MLILECHISRLKLGQTQPNVALTSAGLFPATEKQCHRKLSESQEEVSLHGQAAWRDGEEDQERLLGIE